MTTYFYYSIEQPPCRDDGCARGCVFNARLVACHQHMSAPAAEPPHTIGSFDVRRYMGPWFGIAHFPTWFERGGHDVRAMYTLLPDGKTVQVHNSCLLWRVRVQIKGTAVVVGPGKLHVSFPHLPQEVWSKGRGNYWILATDYDGYALVGDPAREHLWILSRTPRAGMPRETYDALVRLAADEGFDVSRLQLIPP